MMRRLLSLLFVFALASPAAAALLLGNEKSASPVVPGPTAGRDIPLAVASDGTDFLVVWSSDDFADPATYAARVTADGQVTPMPSHRILGGTITAADLVWTGNAYQMIWTQPGTGVRAARLDRDGNLITGPYSLSSHASAAHALAFNGQNIIVLLSDAQSTLITTLTADGMFVRETRATHVQIGGDARLLAAGDGFVAVWAQNPRTGTAPIRAMAITNDGQPGSPVQVGLASAGVWLDAATDGDRIGIVYTQWPYGVTPAGPLRRATVDARTLAVTEHGSIPATTQPEVVATPDGFVAAVLAARDGNAVLEAIPFDSTSARRNDVDATPAGRLRTASNGSQILAVWSRGYIAGALFDATFEQQETDAFVISTKYTAQGWPQLAPAGDVALLTWIEETALGGNLMAVRIDRVGHAIGAPVLVGSGEWIETGHAAIFTGEGWLVAWQARGTQAHPQTFVRRLALDATPLDEPLDFGVGGPFTFASNGNVVVGTRANAFGVNVHRFGRDGALLGAQPSIATTEFVSDVAIASNGTEFLLVWLEIESANRTSLAGRRLDATGDLLGATMLIDGAPATWRPDVIADGEDYLVAYQRDATSILMKRVDRTGVLEGTSASLPGPTIASGVNPRLSFLGSRLAVSHLTTASGTELQLTTVDDKASLPVAQSFDWIHHDAASRGEALWLAYVRTVPELGGIPRVFVRVAAEAPGKRRSARR